MDMSSDWTLLVKQILSLCNFEHNWTNQIPLSESDVGQLKRNLRKIFLNTYHSTKMPTHMQHSLASQTNLNNTTFKPAEYTKFDAPLIYKKSITRMRLQSNRLGIITGRFTRPITPQNDRICLTCKTIDDEKHALLHCKLTTQARLLFQHDLNVTFNNFETQNDDVKLNILLNPTSREETLLSGKYIHTVAKIRNIF